MINWKFLEVEYKAIILICLYILLTIQIEALCMLLI